MSVRSFKEKKSLEISFYSDIRSHTLTLVFVCFKFRLVCLFVWLDKTRIVKPLGRFHPWRLATQDQDGPALSTKTARRLPVGPRKHVKRTAYTT